MFLLQDSQNGLSLGSAGGQSMYGDEEELQKQMASMALGKFRRNLSFGRSLNYLRGCLDSSLPRPLDRNTLMPYMQEKKRCNSLREWLFSTNFDKHLT
jgi:hypothetical protein